MAAGAAFDDLDNKAVYDQSLAKVLDESTRNFVVNFGQKEAKIAFNLGVDDLKALLKSGPPPESPVRWMYASSAVLSYPAVSCHEALSN